MAPMDAPVRPADRPDEEFDAFVVRRDGPAVTAGMERLAGADLPEGDVLVAVRWSAVNFKDGMVSQPGSKVTRVSPLVPGVDLAGVILASADPGLAAGTEVIAHGQDIGVGRHGGFAGLARLPAAWVLPVPAGLDLRQAMVVGTAGFTAALSVDELERHGLTPSDGPVLVTGAAGGVGSLSVSILARRGYHVVASTGRSAEAPWLQSLGAADVVGREALEDAPDRVLGGERWAAAVDCVGGATLGRVLRTLRYGAAVAASGLTGGAELATTVYPFITRQVALLGVDSVRTPRERRLEVWGRLGSDLRPEHLDALVDEEVGLEEVGGALGRVLDGKVRGRVLVRVAAG